MAARKGLNATLSYHKGGQVHSYQVRANLVAHGLKVIYTESSARTRRVFYPHRLSSAQFVVGIELMGEAEYVSFSTWLAEYADYVITQNTGTTQGTFAAMTVHVPSRNFHRIGVPLSGFTFGDQTAKMVWPVQCVFESFSEGSTITTVNRSYARGSALTDSVTKYFYPTGTQLAGADNTPTLVLNAFDIIPSTSPAAPVSAPVTAPTNHKNEAL